MADQRSIAVSGSLDRRQRRLLAGDVCVPAQDKALVFCARYAVDSVPGISGGAADPVPDRMAPGVSGTLAVWYDTKTGMCCRKQGGLPGKWEGNQETESEVRQSGNNSDDCRVDLGLVEDSIRDDFCGLYPDEPGSAGDRADHLQGEDG